MNAQVIINYLLASTYSCFQSNINKKLALDRGKVTIGSKRRIINYENLTGKTTAINLSMDIMMSV